MSFGPFLGGKRISLGKTFAENKGKSVLPIILSQLNFQFPERSELFHSKPSNSMVLTEPEYMVEVLEVLK